MLKPFYIQVWKPCNTAGEVKDRVNNQPEADCSAIVFAFSKQMANDICYFYSCSLESRRRRARKLLLLPNYQLVDSYSSPPQLLVYSAEIAEAFSEYMLDAIKGITTATFSSDEGINFENWAVYNAQLFSELGDPEMSCYIYSNSEIKVNELILEFAENLGVDVESNKTKCYITKMQQPILLWNPKFIQA